MEDKGAEVRQGGGRGGLKNRKIEEVGRNLEDV
jgi:hypothetical protein